MNIISQLMDVSSTDQEDARRRKLLNIMLLGLLSVDVLALVITGVILVTGLTEQAEDLLLIMIGGLVMLVGVGVIFAINRYRSGVLASSLFLLLLTAVFAFSDVPKEVADGRSLFLFTVPIIMASVLLQPVTSFLIAGLCGVVISVIAMVEVDILPNVPAIIGFFSVALVSWLSARSLERALEDLRAINQELDQRVIARTKDLAEALARVQAESSKSQAILESIADGVIVFDYEGKAIVANPSSGYLLGRSPDSIDGLDIESLMGQDVQEDDREMVAGVVRSKQTSSAGAKFEWGDKTLSVSFAAVRDDSGQATGTVVVLRDYTREAEVDRMKNQFVSMVSHELRTPLNAILGYSDMLHEEVYGGLSEEQRSTVERIIANTKRMFGLVNNLLDQAQMQAGKLILNKAPFEVYSLIEEMRSVMGVLATQKGLSLDYSIAGNVPEKLVSDSQRLHQILVNLVGNAIKFTDQGGINVHVFCPDQRHWALEISDTGPGIPIEAQSYVFEPFRQVDDSASRHQGGTGLGLAIVKQLVNLLDGDITLVSRLGHGSTFTINLPLIATQEQMT